MGFSISVVCGSHYLPRNDLGLYPQCTKVLIPSGSKRRTRTEEIEKAISYVGSGYDPEQQEYNFMMHANNINDGFIDHNYGNDNQETLPLFPLHPTGRLQGRTSTIPSHDSNSEENSIAPSRFSVGTNTGTENGSGEQPFFDFFSGRRCESTDH